MSYIEHALDRPGPRRRRGVAVGLALLLAIASVVGLSQAAHAATPGITANILLNGETYDGTAVVNEGDTMTLRVQYNTDVTPGSTVVFDLGANVTVTGVPATNTAIATVVQDGNKVSVTFRDPWPAEVNQGVFDLRFKVNDVDDSVKDKLTWEINGEETSVDVIIRNGGDQFENVTDNQTKTLSGNYNNAVTVDADGTVHLNPSVIGKAINYTLTASTTTAQPDYVISDQLPDGPAYVDGTFAATLTTWDADGLNRTTAPFAFDPTVTGNSFTETVDLPANSVLSITYQAAIPDEAARADLEGQLQDKADLIGLSGGSFTVPLTNTATIGGTEKTATVNLTGSKPNQGPTPGNQFGKTADWSSQNITPAADGTLTPAQPITYTFKVDLRAWDGSNALKTLDRNVVVTDTLPAQADWNTAAGFLSSPDLALTAVAPCPADISTDDNIGKYCVNGKTLQINVGKTNTTNTTIDAKALITTVAGLTPSTSGSVKTYPLRNTAAFKYSSANAHTVNRDVSLVDRGGSADGVNDPDVFTKTGAVEDDTIDPGETVTVDYTLTVAADNDIDLRTSKLVDYVDAEVFDVSDPDAVEISGTYDGQALNASHFALSQDADGNLVIELSDAGKAIVTSRGADKTYVVHLTLTSMPFVGKETKTIKNKATLFGTDGDPLYWSQTEADATSYGDEAEVRKRVFDRASEEWVDTLKAQMDGQGHLVQDTYVYRIEFIPHGSYNHVVIVPVDDILPDAADFLGFVTKDNAATATDPTPGPVDIGGNLVATYDAGTGTVTIEQEDGTVLEAGAPIAAYVAVRITDPSVPIVNKIGNSTATIVPLKSVSVGDFVWVDSDRDGRQEPGEPGIPGVVLTVVGPDGQPVTDVFGHPVGPVTTGLHGEYTFTNLPALSGSQTYTVRIDRGASAEALAPYTPTRPGQGDRVGDSSTWEASSQPGDLHEDGDRDPTLDFGFVRKTYAVGDVVWIDADRDGVQDAGEKPLAGVKVALLKDGKVVGTTTTDAHGRYVFDNLPAGTYQVRFTLTDQQKRKYRFTTRNAGANDAVDSDARAADGLTATFVLDDSNTALTGDYDYRQIGATQGIDPTWDAGVVLKRAGAVDSDDDTSAGSLANTGAGFGLGLLALTLSVLAAGGSLLLAGRRRRREVVG